MIIQKIAISFLLPLNNTKKSRGFPDSSPEKGFHQLPFFKQIRFRINDQTEFVSLKRRNQQIAYDPGLNIRTDLPQLLPPPDYGRHKRFPFPILLLKPLPDERVFPTH